MLHNQFSQRKILALAALVVACVPSACGATGRGQAGGHVRGAARLRVASSRFAVRSSAVLCGEGERKRPLLFSPAGHFRRAVGAALRRM